MNYFEDKNMAVITTSFVLSGSQIILAFHYENDGLWEFVSAEDVKEGDYKVVSLDEILLIDYLLMNYLQWLPAFMQKEIVIKKIGKSPKSYSIV